MLPEKSAAINMQQIGAKAAIATLWQVDDPSTAQLMQFFYRNLSNSKTPITKAEALRQAQLSLLRGDRLTKQNIDKRGIRVDPKPGTSPRNQQNTSNSSHPYYWAPFILIGNGL